MYLFLQCYLHGFLTETMCTTYMTSTLPFHASSSWFPSENHVYYLLYCAWYPHDHHAHPMPIIRAPSYLNKLLD